MIIEYCQKAYIVKEVPGGYIVKLLCGNQELDVPYNEAKMVLLFFLFEM